MTDGLRRSDTFSLWLGRANAAAVARDPDGVLARGRERLEQMMERAGRPNSYYERWRELIDEGPEAVMRMLCDTGEEGQALRSASPFMAVISIDERDQIFARFTEWWGDRDESGVSRAR
jgi:hypothetical protein